MRHKTTNTIAEFQTFTLEQIQKAYRHIKKDYTFSFTQDTPEKCQEILEVLAKDGQVFTVDFDGIYYSYFSNMAGIILFTVVSVPQERVRPTFALNEIVNSNKKK